MSVNKSADKKKNKILKRTMIFSCKLCINMFLEPGTQSCDVAQMNHSAVPQSTYYKLIQKDIFAICTAIEMKPSINTKR